MEIDFKALKQVVDDTILTEAKCMQAIQSLLAKDNETLHNPVLEKIISVLEKWSTTPPVDILKELEDFQSKQNSA